jgi:hypothetical protein
MGGNHGHLDASPPGKGAGEPLPGAAGSAKTAAHPGELDRAVDDNEAGVATADAVPIIGKRHARAEGAAPCRPTVPPNMPP